MPPIVLPEVLALALAAVLTCLTTTYLLVNGHRSLRLFLVGIAGAALMLWLAGTLLELVGAVPASRQAMRQMQLWSGGLAGLAAAWLCLGLPTARLRASALPVTAGFAGVLWRLAHTPVSGYQPDLPKLPAGPEGLTITAKDISPDLVGVLLLLVLALGMTGLLWRCRGLLFPEVVLSLNRMVKRLPDRVVVFDADGHLLDRNLEALPPGMMPESIRTLDAFLGRLSSLLHPEAALVLPSADVLLAETAGRPFEALLPLSWRDEDLYFHLHATSLSDRSGPRIGLVCSLQDVTETCRTARLLQRRNTELEALNRELSDYLHIAGTLASEREHSQVSRQIHETLGQRLTGILSVLEVVRRCQSGEDAPRQAAALDEAIAGCRAMMKDIRAIVSGLLPEPEKAPVTQSTPGGTKP